MKFAENVIRFRPAPRTRNTDELAFLPAALEIVETPPSPVGHVLAFVVIMVFSLALSWAIFGTVDIVAVAPGKIIPSGRLKIIQPFETGVVRAINVRDGQSVKVGDALLELDQFYRNYWKYRRHPRAYPVIYMDCARMSQTFSLACAERGVGAFVMGAINTRNIEKHLRLDSYYEGPLLICGCGIETKTRHGLDPVYESYSPIEARERDWIRGAQDGFLVSCRFGSCVTSDAGPHDAA